jgi:hypothetical protein
VLLPRQVAAAGQGLVTWAVAVVAAAVAAGTGAGHLAVMRAREVRRGHVPVTFDAFQCI